MNASTKSILFFMIVYLGSMSILAIGTGYLYYNDEKKSLIEQMRLDMRYKVKSINARLEYYHRVKSESFTFYDEGYDIALYDKNQKNIASTFDTKIDFSQFFYKKGNAYYLVESLYKEYLGVKYIVLKKSLPEEKLERIVEDITLISIYGFIFLLFVALLLSQIMLYPIKKTMTTLKTFIKNTTHEMNTPISTILMSYEHFDRKNLNEKQIRAIKRIEIATKTLSSLYNDLSYASFHDHIEYKDTQIDVKAVLLERIHYMDTLIKFKEIELKCTLEPVIIAIDKRKLILIIDNLLSNAIKFSKKGDSVELALTHEYFSIKDHGIGIDKKDQKRIFQRFQSAATVNGGFGVGLDIVSQICKEYDIQIKLHSELSKGSKFKLIWAKS